MAYQVNNKMCRTCIFTSRSPVSPERFKQLKQAWADNDTGQNCHHSTGKGGQVGCRGHYEASRRGEIPTPLRTPLSSMMATDDLTNDDVLQLCERLRFVEFVPVDDE